MRYGHLAMSIFCAWVLWSDVNYPDTRKSWVLHSAWESKAECEQALKESLAWHKTRPKTQVEKNSVFIEGPTGYFSFSHCFPDTLDPRAPNADR